MDSDLRQTPLYGLHLELGARMVPFAGYQMPVQYPPGLMAEHLQTRERAGLFDVSHMGQAILRPRSGRLEDAALALERLVPVDVLGLKPGRQRYGLFTNAEGGIEDDLMIANRGDHLFLVVNAATKAADMALMQAGLPEVEVTPVEDRALLALQGPLAQAALAELVPEAPSMRFMDVLVAGDLWISRSGYTGEDGFEISLPAAQAEDFFRRLLASAAGPDGASTVLPVGLGARDSLRLEAGLCLYGNDIDASTTPVEAALEWAIQKARRRGGAREGGFPGAERVLRELESGAARRRVGLLPDGRAPMRAGTPLFAAEDAAEPVGQVTSGAFGPSIGRPMSMGYVATDRAADGTPLWGEVRGRRLPAAVAPLPFRPATYKR
jgi:aminomethyltransferase